jgi:hypothetical protein
MNQVNINNCSDCKHARPFNNDLKFAKCEAWAQQCVFVRQLVLNPTDSCPSFEQKESKLDFLNRVWKFFKKVLTTS